MSSGNKRNGENNGDQDKNRLCQAFTTQEFSWTGLKGTTSKHSSQLAVPLEGLVLWNVLGFALGEERDYASFSRVNKEWNQIVRALVPPVLVQMKARIGQNRKLKVEDLSLLKTALESLRSKESKFYRQDIKEGWPLLQPQFGLTLVRYVYTGCTQRQSDNLSRELYRLVSDIFESLAECTTTEIIECLVQDSRPAQNALGDLLLAWETWNGVVGNVKNIAGYLDRYYVKQHSVPLLLEKAQLCLVAGLLGKPAFGVALTSFMKRLDPVKDDLPQPLLQSVLGVMQAAKSFSMTAKKMWTDEGFGNIIDRLEQIQMYLEEQPTFDEVPVSEENEDTAAEMTIVFPNKMRLDIPSHFLSCGGLLQNLNLCSGDVIYWDNEADLVPFQKALDFYALDAHTPMPLISTPLRSSVIRDIVGPQFAEFVETMPNHTLFSVAAMANFLDTKKLLDLSVFAVSITIKGKSAAELRAIFNTSD